MIWGGGSRVSPPHPPPYAILHRVKEAVMMMAAEMVTLRHVGGPKAESSAS